jgi:cell wall-associated NlpC family hydrolase
VTTRHAVQPSLTAWRRRLAFLSLAALTALPLVPLGPTAAYAAPHRSIAEVTARVETLHHRAEQATERYNVAREELAGVRKRLSALHERIDRQQRRIADLEAEIGAVAAAAYRSGGIAPELQLLVADDPQEFLGTAATLERFSARQHDMLEELATIRQRLAVDRRHVAGEAAHAVRTRERLAAEKVEVQRTLRHAQRVLRTLKEAQQRRLERQRERAAAAAARAAVAAEQAAEETAQDTAELAGTAGPAPVETSSRGAAAASGSAAAAVAFAYAQVGEPYVWAAAGPDSWDCSGLTMAAWAQAGVSLPHSSSMQLSSGTSVSQSELQPGDLVFFYSPVSHVGLYVGGGQLVHATHPGDVVSVDPISIMPFAGAVRP